MHIVSRQTSVLQGVFTVPGSKSDTIRALIFALLSQGISRIDHCLASDDTNDAMRVCAALGAQIQRQGEQVIVTSQGLGFPSPQQIHTGNSGLTTRLILPLLGLRAETHHPVQLQCGTQMQARPMAGLIHALNALGMHITPTLSVTGKLIGGTVTLNEPISQYLSALLIALPLAENDSEIIMPHGGANSYIKMTLAWLNRQHIQYHHETHDTYDCYLIKGNQHYHPFDFTVPGDFSSASTLIAAGALIPGKIVLKGLNQSDLQGDKQLLSLLQQMGAHMDMQGNDITIYGGKPLHGIEIDAQNIPDLLPALSVIGTRASGKTVIRHVSQARLKETDRIRSMHEGLSSMGGRLEEMEDGLIIHPSPLKGAQVKGYDDHRTVMALSLAGLIAEGETRISDAQAIQKTFPTFVQAMQQLGGNMEVHDAQ